MTPYLFILLSGYSFADCDDPEIETYRNERENLESGPAMRKRTADWKAKFRLLLLYFALTHSIQTADSVRYDCGRH